MGPYQPEFAGAESWRDDAADVLPVTAMKPGEGAAEWVLIQACCLQYACDTLVLTHVLLTIVGSCK